MMYNKPQPRLLNVNKIPSQPKKRKKITLVFDEKKRREFLGGFRKRKLERKRKAQEQLEKQLKEERKKIKQNVRERYKKFLSHRNIPELEELLSQKEYDLENHTVSVLELNIADLTKGNRWIGENKIVEEEDKQDEESGRSDDNDDDDDDDDNIVGMSLQDNQNLESQETESTLQDMTSSREVKKEIKKEALRQVKESKVFRKKQRMEQIKNRKQSKRKLRKAHKLARKHGKQIKKGGQKGKSK